MARCFVTGAQSPRDLHLPDLKLDPGVVGRKILLETGAEHEVDPDRRHGMLSAQPSAQFSANSSLLSCAIKDTCDRALNSVSFSERSEQKVTTS
jgi:hypothetical protein